ncbi:MAG: hypothetical protein ACO3E4_05990 [Candidatus Nanopelagicaceae bacterium]
MTKQQLIAELKLTHPEIYENIDGVQIEITGDAYEAMIEKWAVAQLAKEKEEQDAASAKASAIAKLEALGLTVGDLKALGF